MSVAPARPASAVVLVRPAGSGPADVGPANLGPATFGWETYLLRRSAQSPVLPDFWVFPGGTVRTEDSRPAGAMLIPRFSPADAHAALARAPGHSPSNAEESLAYFVTAARELFEEAGILLASTDGPQPRTVSQALPEQRLAIERGRPFAELVADLGVALALDRLVYYGHWITPEALPQRFDTRFFLARLVDGEAASPSPFEMAEGLWITVEDALERATGGAFPLHFATLSHLRRLAPYRGLEDLLEFARTKPVAPVMPATRQHDGRIAPFLPPELEGVW